MLDTTSLKYNYYRGTTRPWQYVFATFVVLVSIRLWSFQGFPDGFYDGLEFVCLGLMPLFIFLYRENLKASNMLFKYYVGTFIFVIPAISTFAAYYYHGQAAIFSVMILRSFLFWQFYFLLHAFKIPKQWVIKLLIIVGCVWGFLTVIQQFTYPVYFFFTRSDDKGGFHRENIYRFMVFRHQYGMFAGLLFFSFFLTLRKWKYLFYTLLMLVAFYYFGTRQFAGAFVLSLALMALSQKGAKKLFSIAVMLAFGAVLYTLKDQLFGKLIEMTSQQLNSTDDVRIYAGKFFLYHFWPNDSFISRLLGNGLEHYGSAYGQQVKNLTEQRGFNRVDVGLIGIFNAFGVTYIINMFLLNLKGCRAKWYPDDMKWMRYLFFSELFLSILTNYYNLVHGIPYFCLVFYLVDKLYQEKKLTSNLTLATVEDLPAEYTDTIGEQETEQELKHPIATYSGRTAN